VKERVVKMNWSAANQERKDDGSIGSFQAENEVLRERAKALEEKVSENEKKLEKRRVSWQLCSRHELNGKAVVCAQKQDGIKCPFYASSTQSLLDILTNMPGAFDATLKGLNLGDAINCRRVCKALKSLVDNDFKYSLPLAAARGDVEWVRKLIAAGVNVNATLTRYDQDHQNLPGRMTSRMSPLAMAAFSTRPQHTEVGRLLIKAGADLEAEDAMGMTPLFVAAQNGGEFSGSFLKMMIEAGAEVDDYDSGGPLLAAVERLDTMADQDWASENVKILVKAGADVCRNDLYEKHTAFTVLVKVLIGRAMKAGLSRLEKDLELLDLFIAAGATNPLEASDPNESYMDRMGPYVRWSLFFLRLSHQYKICENQKESTRIDKITDKAIKRIAKHLGVKSDLINGI